MNGDINSDNLKKFYSCLENDKPIPNNLKFWFLDGVDDLYSVPGKTLDKALGLSCRAGISSIATRHKKKVIDKLIFELLTLNKTSSKKFESIKKTAKMLNDFHNRTGKRILKTNSEERSEIEQLLVKIFEVDEKPPMSPSSLNIILMKYGY